MNIIKPLGTSITLTTANTVGNASCVYVSANAESVITVAYANTTTKGTFVIPANQYIFVQKDPTDTVAASVAVAATSAAFRG